MFLLWICFTPLCEWSGRIFNSSVPFLSLELVAVVNIHTKKGIILGHKIHKLWTWQKSENPRGIMKMSFDWYDLTIYSPCIWTGLPRIRESTNKNGNLYSQKCFNFYGVAKCFFYLLWHRPYSYNHLLFLSH